MNYKQISINTKVFQINSNHHELVGKSFELLTDTIKNNHIRHLNAKYDDITNIKPTLVYSEAQDFQYCSYCFNQPKDQYYWQLFLPDQIVATQDFEITEFSFVLFIHYKGKTYCVIGGSGSGVIKKYLNHTFGIELYQHFADTRKDIVLEMNSRGIASNISQKRHTYNLNQSIAETLEYSEIPTKIKLLIRPELKKTLFKKYRLGAENSILEIGSYFSIKKKIDFPELMVLIKDLYDIEASPTVTQLTLFHKVEDEQILQSLDDDLKNKIAGDIAAYANPQERNNANEDIIEIVHPTKLEQFYECNRFIIKASYSRGKGNIEVDDRNKLYRLCTKHIYDRLDDIQDTFKIKGELYKLKIEGYLDERNLTYHTFYAHVIAELSLHGKKFFRIDDKWYSLKDEFIKLMTQDAIEYYEAYSLSDNILKPWQDGDDEDAYNMSHDGQNHYILDKRYKENIELCDILVEQDDKLYFVHVKNGFGTKLRECYIQVILSAKRLSVDLKDSNGEGFLRSTLEYYNTWNPKKAIDVEVLLTKIKEKKLKPTFVLAYNNTKYSGKSALEKIQVSKSNIAKYSIVQVVKEIQQYFPIKLIDISSLNEQNV